MCGVLFIKQPEKFGIDTCRNALNLMNHRGPDNNSYEIINRNFIGHTRLAIIDLDERSNQPFHLEDLCISFNGEIYNYKELIVEHSLNPRTNSDTEVLLLMYRKYGKECLKYLNGMFAFVILDKVTNEIFVARDRLGVKPLYYKIVGESIIFSSEVAPILEISPSSFNDFGIRQYLKLRMTVQNDTIYEGVNSFPAGTYFDGASFTRYWDVVFSTENEPDYDEVECLIKNSVEIRKRADVAVGSYLSGGLDSSILTALIKPECSWTVGFRDDNEFYWATKANERVNSTHDQLLVDCDTFQTTHREMVAKRKEPLCVPNEVLLYLMTERASQKNKVIFSGEGADELFWGYDRIFRWAQLTEKSSLTVEDFDSYYCYGSTEDNDVVDYAISDLPGDSVLDKVAYFFQIRHLHGLLRRLDNSTMLCSVEGRVPFVDYRLVELMARASFEWKMGKSFKQPLKDIFQSILPTEIVERPKVGFPVPLEKIYRTTKKSSYDMWFRENLTILGYET